MVSIALSTENICAAPKYRWDRNPKSAIHEPCPLDEDTLEFPQNQILTLGSASVIKTLQAYGTVLQLDEAN